MEKRPYYLAYQERYEKVFAARADHWGHTPDDEVLFATLKKWVEDNNLVGKRVIEFACGEGACGVILSKLGCYYHGVDIAQSAVNKTKEAIKGLPNATAEIIDMTKVAAGPGGKGSNQAIAAKRAGCDLVFSTKLGEDSFAKIGWQACEMDKVSSEYIFTSKTVPTGAALISVDEITSQNEIIVILGANETFTSEELQKLDKALDGCEYLLLQLEINLDAVYQLVDIAASKNIKVILNPAPVQNIVPQIYKKLYMVTPNEVEAKILTGITYEKDEDCKKIADIFFEMGVKTVLITLGKRGVYVNDGTKEVFIDNYELPVVDTTGAGDAFNGGLLAGLGRGMDLFTAAAYGNVISNIAVTKMGTAPAMPYASEIDTFIAEYGLKL